MLIVLLFYSTFDDSVWLKQLKQRDIYEESDDKKRKTILCKVSVKFKLTFIANGFIAFHTILCICQLNTSDMSLNFSYLLW